MKRSRRAQMRPYFQGGMSYKTYVIEGHIPGLEIRQTFPEGQGGHWVAQLRKSPNEAVIVAGTMERSISSVLAHFKQETL